MRGQKTVDKRINIYAVVFMMFVTALFVLSLANSASAYPFTLQGKVTSIDSDGKKLAIQEDQCGMGGQYAFTWDNNATVMRGNEFLSFNDIAVGDEIRVTYYEKSPGLFVAENIDIPTMPERC